MPQPSSLISQTSKKAPSVLATKRKFSNALFERVVKNLIQGSDTHPAIEKEGISKSMFYLELTKRPELAHRFKEAQYQRDKVRNAKRIESAEAELHRRGVDGWDEPVFDIKGNHCGNKRRFSDACLIFMLKSLKPDVFAGPICHRVRLNQLGSRNPPVGCSRCPPRSPDELSCICRTNTSTPSLTGMSFSIPSVVLGDGSGCVWPVLGSGL